MDSIGFKEFWIVRWRGNMSGKGIPKTRCEGREGKLEMSGTIDEKFDRICVLLGSQLRCTRRDRRRGTREEISAERLL